MKLDDQNFFFLGKESILKGDIELYGPAHICGNLNGNIKIKDKFKLTIEPTAKVEGTINGHDIDIYGEVHGDVLCEGTLRIFPSSTIHGKINARSLVIKPGAVINITGHTLEK